MMQNTSPIHMSDLSHFGWLARASAASAVRSGRYFVVLMRKAAVREQTRRELAELDEHVLRDIGLDPLDVYYGWRGTAR